MYYIGLDVHKRKISYCVKDASGQLHAEGGHQRIGHLVPDTKLLGSTRIKVFLITRMVNCLARMSGQRLRYRPTAQQNVPGRGQKPIVSCLKGTSFFQKLCVFGRSWRYLVEKPARNLQQKRRSS